MNSRKGGLAAAKKRKEIKQELEKLRKNLALHEPIAVQVAEVITDLRDEITYYEEQALFHKLPTYPRKSGGPDRTRTG